jgi:hypothetical protein
MWTELKTARDGHMSPIERAIVIGAAFACIGLLALLFDEQKGPERFRIWELALFVGVMIALGLMSALRFWWRVPLYAALGTAVFIGTGVLAGRPHMLDAGMIVSSLLSSVIQAAGIGAIDLPPFWRRWANIATTSLGRMAKWSVYYVVTAIAWLLLVASVDGLCDALVSTVLPSPKIAKSTSEVGIGIGLFGVAAIILLAGRTLPSMIKSLRIVQPALWALLIVIAFMVQSELLNIGIANSKLAFPPFVDQVTAREETKQWLTDPATALRDRLVYTAIITAFFAPVSIALFAAWDSARAKTKRSFAVSAIVLVLVVAFCTLSGGSIGLLVDTVKGDGVSNFINRVGATLGLVVGLVCASLWLRWTTVPEMSEEITAAKYVSGVAEVPEHVAKAVQVSREAVL